MVLLTHFVTTRIQEMLVHIKMNRYVAWALICTTQTRGKTQTFLSNRIVKRRQRRRRKRRGNFFWGLTDRRMDGLFKVFFANQAPGIFLRQIGPGILGPDKMGSSKLDPAYWVPTNRALANLAPENFCFANWAPKISLAANWAQKNFVQQIYNTLFLQLRGFCISVFIFATFSSMRPYPALKALNSHFHLNIWTHL